MAASENNIKRQQTFYSSSRQASFFSSLIELLLNCLIKLNYINTEAAARRCSLEKML